tara:strand:+ start:360 stop:695 length:336 start_codon:yes stop_codon:yes gene_type:complete
MSATYSNIVARDAITGEPFGNIRVGSVGELRLLRVCPEYYLGERNISGTKLYFGPVDDSSMQEARYAAYVSRGQIDDEEMMAPIRKKRGKRYNKAFEIGSDELFPGEVTTI